MPSDPLREAIERALPCLYGDRRCVQAWCGPDEACEPCRAADRIEDAVAPLLAAERARREAARKEALEEAARIAEGGRFLHDDAPDARFGRACAAAIRRRAASDGE